MKKQPLTLPRNNLNKKIEVNNLPKSAAQAMLVTSHDINFVMGFIKEDEILTHDNYVRHFFFTINFYICRFYDSIDISTVASLRSFGSGLFRTPVNAC